MQRDLLPLIEGTTVNTKYISVKTDYILFIASGAFHIAKSSDLLPELQEKLPIRVELNSLAKDDMIKILLQPETSLIKQYSALIGTEDVHREFLASAIEEIVEYAITLNLEVEDIGATRLHTILENLLEDISFEASEMKGKKITINDKFAENRLSKKITNHDLAKFVL